MFLDNETEKKWQSSLCCHRIYHTRWITKACHQADE